jgi:uncharacterized protein YaaN involved in tellurite resistance
MSNDLQLVPPESLTPPAPVTPVAETQADGLVKLDPAKKSELDSKASEFVAQVVQQPVHSGPFTQRVTAIHNMGNKDIRAAASVSNRMLNRPTRSMESGLFDEGSEISQALVDLRTTVEDLDPARQGDLFSSRKLLGIIPGGNKMRSYFLKYQSAQSHIDTVLNSLYRGQDELRKDNAAIDQEKANLWQIMEKLQQYVYVGKRIDTALSENLTQLEVTDPEKARLVKEEMLFYVRQKIQDLLTQLAVSIQGYLALDMVRKNNLELIKGVDRATTTTISALRTAVITAQALANQKLVLDQINALNTTTSNLIETTSQMLRQQTGDIYQQATSSTVSLEQLQKAFDNIYESMDMLATYRVEALDNMQQTVDALSVETTRAQTYLDKVRQEEVQEITEDVDLLAAPSDEIAI